MTDTVRETVLELARLQLRCLRAKAEQARLMMHEDGAMTVELATERVFFDAEIGEIVKYIGDTDPMYIAYPHKKKDI